jgi:hypothetical protein
MLVVRRVVRSQDGSHSVDQLETKRDILAGGCSLGVDAVKGIEVARRQPRRTRHAPTIRRFGECGNLQVYPRLYV